MNFRIFRRSLKDLTDDQLIDKYKSSESLDYAAELFDRYLSLIYGVCLKYVKNGEDAKDTSQQIFEKLVKELKRHDIKNFSSWLHSLTRNECLMQLRREKGIHKIGMEEISVTDMENSGLVHQTSEDAREEDLQKLTIGLNGLPEHQKLCVELFYLKKMSYQQIVEHTGFDLKKVKSYIQNGRRNLKLHMEKKDDKQE